MNYLHKSCKLAVAAMSIICMGILVYVIIFLRDQLESIEVANYLLKLMFLEVMLFGSVYTFFRPKCFHVLVICTMVAMFPMIYSTTLAGNDLIMWFSKLGYEQMQTFSSLTNAATRIFWICFTISTIVTLVTSMSGFSKATITMSVATCAFALLTMASILLGLSRIPLFAKRLVQIDYMIEFLMFAVATITCVAQFYAEDIEKAKIKEAYAYDELGFEKHP